LCPEKPWNAQAEGHFDVTKVGAVLACLVPPSPFTSAGFDLNLKGRSSSAVAAVSHFHGLREKLMSLNYLDKKTGMAAMRTNESGFSMIEMMIVCVIMAIIAGIAVPNIFQTFRNYQLDAAGHSVASLLQQARIQAVKTNLPAYVNYTNATGGNLAFVTNDPANTTYTAGEPDIQLSPAVTFQATPPDHSQLDAYINAAPSAGNVSIGFNARGLPCIESGGNPTVCSAPAGFEWFMQSAGGWEAVTVTPSGRIKSWRLSMATGGTCGFTACWL
jgi:prepilin-type N-terminal cleavage/methylation domain-containing protein